MVGRRAAAAADDVDEPVAGEAADLGRHRLGALVILAEGVGKAGVGIGADERIGRAGNLLQMFAHRARSEGAVETDGEGAGMADRVPESGRRLAGERASRTVGDRPRDHQRQPDSALGEDLLAGENGRLGVQRVEDRLDQNEVGAAVDEAAYLLAIGDPQLVEVYGAKTGVVDVGRQRRGAVGGAERAGDEAAAAVRPLRLDRRPPGESRAVAIELVDDVLHAVVGLGDRCRRKGVGLENVSAGHRIGEVDVLDRLRLSQDQEVVVALQMAFANLEAIAAEMALGQTERLNLGAHRAVQNQNALTRRLAKGVRRALLMPGRSVENGIERPTHSRPPGVGAIA